MWIQDFNPPENLQEPITYILQPTFRPARNYPGGNPINLIVRSRMYPAPNPTRRKGMHRREPPRTPTARKLKARESFTETQHCLELSPYNEQHAYWSLAHGTGFSSFNYWTHLNLWRIHRNAETCADISRPHTFVTDPDQAPLFPAIVLWWPRNEDIYLDFQAVLDPGTYRTNPTARYTNCPYYVWDRISFTPSGYGETGWIIRPIVARQQYNLRLFLPHAVSANTFLWRRIVFLKQVQELTAQTVLWKFEVAGQWDATMYRHRAFIVPDGVVPE